MLKDDKIHIAKTPVFPFPFTPLPFFPPSLLPFPVTCFHNFGSWGLFYS